MESVRCPNCDSMMNAGDGESCPECPHRTDDPDCECQTCVWNQEYAAEEAELRMEVDDGR